MRLVYLSILSVASAAAIVGGGMWVVGVDYAPPTTDHTLGLDNSLQHRTGTTTASMEPTTIVLITLESVRADHIGPCYRYERRTAPHICGLADDGVLFERAYAQGSWTPVSIPTLLTARTPRAVGLNSWEQRLSLDATTVLERLQRFGYRSYIIAHQRMFDAGFAQGADVVDRPQQLSESTWNASRFNQSVVWYFPGDHTHRPFTPDVGIRPFTTLTMPPQEIARQWDNLSKTEVLGLYDSAISNVDSEVGSIIRRLRSAGLYEDSLIVVTADHGEQFGEHGRFAIHGPMPYNEVVHVPLIVKFPDNQFSGQRVHHTVRHIDIAHTLLDAVGDEQRFGTVGRSLLALLRDSGSTAAASGLSERTVFAAGRSNRFWMVQQDNLTLIRQVITANVTSPPHTSRLYNLTADPYQQHPLPNLSRAAHLNDELLRLFTIDSERMVEEQNLSDQMRNRLKDLGYLD